MNFYIPFFQPLAGGDNRVPQISALVVISPARVDYPYRLTFLGDQISSIQELILPDFDNEALREIVCQP